MSVTDALQLDPSLLVWALLPIMVITACVSFGRVLMSILLKSDTSKVDVKDHQYKQTLQRAARLRANGRYLTAEAIKNREKFFLAPDGGKLIADDIPAPDPSEALSKLGNMNMGGQMVMMVTQMTMYTFINNFFPGFVIMKLPFPITERLRPLLQNGLSVPTLDVSYVTCLSWYFLVMFGMAPFVSLLASKLSKADFSDVMLQQQMGMGMQAKQPQQFDAKKALGAEAKMFGAFTKYATDMTAAKAASEKLAGIKSK